ncbi:MAG TPA: hypothetical protein EYH30_04420 [Anaerolineales bacterium]|nr:hypothetical protein [Anaerolineales bacterium]
MCYTDDVFGFLADLPLPGYPSLLALGLSMGTALAVLLGRRRGLTALAVVDGALAGAAGGLLIGRVVYAAAHWPYFHDHMGEVPMVWRGGLSAPGAVVGGIVGVLVLCRARRVGPRPLLDTLAPGAALVVISAWLGCLGAGCGCGLPVRPDQGLLWALSAELPDLYGLRAPRVAVPALGAVWGMVTLAGLLLGRWDRPFPLWLLLYAGGDLGLGFLREDVTPWLAGLAGVQVADLALALAGLTLLTLPIWGGRGERPHLISPG